MGVRRGFIYWVDFGPPRGIEKAYRRPAVVMSINSVNDLPLVVVVVPGTKGENRRRDFPTNVRVLPTDSGLPIETVFQAFDVTAIDPSKISVGEIGQLSLAVMSKLEVALKLVLGLT